MAGNLQGDNSGNIYVEFDYNNLIVVDPNKTIDAFGKIKERLVDHENLVMYANLEAEVLPRTKLAVGASPEDRQRTISVAKMNFLKPTKDTYLGTGYYDELTGENTTKFKGENQMLSQAVDPKNGTKPYIKETVADQKNVFDNGLLGITQINVTTNSSFIPTVTMELEDVQGRALFQLGNNSPYAAFFNLPYPPFYLTLKGYYGQAIRYQLNLETFNARFNSVSGNYQVSLKFKGYKFNVLNEIAMGHLLATPHMYSQTFDVTQSPVSTQSTAKSVEAQGRTESIQNNVGGANQSDGKNAVVTQLIAKKGYQKIVEVYSEYKSKGLISPDFPELTLVQLMTKLDNFERNIVASFPPADVEPLTNIRNYKQIVQQYFNTIRASDSSWFNTYLNPRPIVLIGGQRIYVFKPLELSVKKTAVSLLESHIIKFNAGLAQNPTLGNAGPSPIPNPIKYEVIVIERPVDADIDWEETAKLQGYIKPTEIQIKKVQAEFGSEVLNVANPLSPDAAKINEEIQKYARMRFVFEGNGRFDKQIGQLETQANKKLSEYEASISAQLLRKIEDTDTGIGFKPTIRNMIAVVMASAEAFIRLMDDVHTNAWAVKYDPVRKKAIMDNPSSAPSTETRGVVKISNSAQNANQGLSTAQEPVYPWPQFFVESPEDKKGRFQLKYIADPTVVDQTDGWNFSKWPEVEFVEEYMKGLTQKFYSPPAPPPIENQRDTNIININAIEYPSSGIAYVNKEEIKFFYEIWERQFLTSHYSGLVRANSNQIDELIRLNIETETNNIKTSLGVSAPYLTLKLKNYDLTASNYPQFLSNISNTGTGRAYQDFIRDFYVTPYIKTITENSFSILSVLDIGKIPQTTAKSDALASLLKNASNEPLIVDTLPYTDPTWSLNNLETSEKSKGDEVYNTKNTLTIFEPRKIIANFNDVYNYTTNRPVTNFSYLVTQNPTTIASTGLAAFYLTRQPKNFIATEGYYGSLSPSILQLREFRSTTSMLNTPYFTNAIQNGVNNFRRNDKYPYVQAAYLFLNSLPLASLRERYKTNTNNVMSELDYISSCFKKFGAIHKLPYAWILKYGSIWHRYKKYTETGVDILTTAWTNFNYVNNYSPINNSTTQTYSFKYPVVVNNKVTNEQRDVTLQTENTTDVNMQVGFYPKLINDFNVFYNGYDLYSGYTSEEIQKSINSGMKMYNFNDSNINNATQGTKQVRLITWSVIVPNLGAEIDTDCNPKNNTKGATYFVIPSFGTNLNQTRNELIEGQTSTPTTSINLTSNTSVYNGSIRCLWSAPNYGYFNNDKIAYPQPDSYINRIYPSGAESPFSLLNTDEYSKIEEIFSVFDKKILDQFEVEFLNFCKPLIDANVGGQVTLIGESPIDTNANFKNFQSIFKSLMGVPAQTDSQTETEYFNNVINNQSSVFINGIRAFMQFDVIVRYGNPSNYNRRVFDSYLSYLSTPIVTDPITFKPYVQGSLPQRGSNVSLTQSRTQNPAAWTALQTQVGFSTISGVAYSSTGSYITDFFIDNNIEFTAQNVVLLAPLIKMYATQKLRTPSLTVAQFKNQLTLYLNQESNLQNNFLNGVLNRLKLPPPIGLSNQQQVPGGAISSAISGEQSKVENYEVFKALNDKWIAGGDYKTKTLFEDMMFLDRASRNIGDTILVDIFDFKAMFNENSLNQAMSVYTFVSGMLIKNNFNVMNLPAYVNFYNVQDVDGTTSTNATEGSLQFADRMWGTYLDVDYRNSSPKMVCFYAGKPSQYLDLPKGNFRFRDDAFEMRRASENPLLENQQGKKDWAVSNKCVGFTVDLGIRNQNIFYSFQVSQDNGVATSESINTQLNMIDQASGRNTATQNVSLYNLYKNRSYKCSVVCLGNALLQPTMYFNLRHVPMFNGPYMIMDVQHSIQQGNFQTSFTGVRQGIFDLPAIDNFLQSINQNLLTKLEAALKIKQNDFTVTGTTNEVKTNQVVQKADNTLDTTNSCVSNLNPIYAAAKFQSINGTATNPTPKEFGDALKRLIPNSPTLQTIIYCISYVRTFQGGKNGNFYGWNNNLGTISLTENWGGTSSDFLQSYSCVNVKTNAASSSSQPMAQFTSLDKYINFMFSRLYPNEGRILEMGLAKYYVCHWPKNNVDPAYYDSHIADYAVVKSTLYKALDSAVEAGIATVDKSKELKKEIKKTEDKGKTPGVTPTPTPLPKLTTQTCPPPLMTSFTPSVGNTGTILQINGRNLSSVTGVTFISQTTQAQPQAVFVKVLSKDITYLNDQTLRLSIPTLGTGKLVLPVKVTVISENGLYSPPTLFTFDPAVSASQTSSPGGYNNTTSNNTTSVAPSVNTNPQPTTLVPIYETAPGGEVTKKLTVNVGSGIGVWNINNVVKMTVSTFDVTTTNNRTIETSRATIETTISNYVVNNVFTITNENIKSMLFDNPIPPFDTKKVSPGQIVKIQFVIQANAVDKVKYPQTTEQSFNFYYNKPVTSSSLTGLSPAELLSKILENQPGSLVQVAESNNVDLPNYSGPSYYNIKKPAGGYITYRFVCNNLKSVQPPTVTAIPSLNEATIIITNTPNTKYTNVIEVKNLGTFQLGVRYTSEDLKWTNPNTNKIELVGGGVTSIPFTL